MSSDPRADNEPDEDSQSEERIQKVEGMRLSSIILTIAVIVLSLYIGFNWLQARKASRKRSLVLASKFSAAMFEGHSFFRKAEENVQSPTEQLRLWQAAITSAQRAQALAALPDSDEDKRKRVDEFLVDLQKEEAKTKKRLELATRNRALVTTLEDLRIPREDDLSSNEATARETLRQDAAYEATFKAHGIFVDTSFEALGRRFAGQMAATISHALDHWTLLRRRLKKPDVEKLAKLASRLYPQHWCEQLRYAHSVGKADRKTLQRLHKEFRYDHWPAANAIYLADTPDEVRPKVLTMVTDPARKRRHDPGNPEICPVFDLHKVFSGDADVEQVNRECRTAEIGCVDCKKMLLRNLEPTMELHRERREALQRNGSRIDEILEEGARRARVAAVETMRAVRNAMGLDPA